MRQSAYEELIAKLDQDAEAISQFEEQFPQMLSDSNVNCQDKAFKLVEGYVAKKHRLNGEPKTILKTIIEKGLSSNKLDIVKSANNILLEMFDGGYRNEVYGSLSDGLVHKNPKIPTSCVEVYTNLLINFGLKKLDMLKPIFKELEQYLETSSITLRNAILGFYKEAFKWLGEGLLAFSCKLKKPLSDEL